MISFQAAKWSPSSCLQARHNHKYPLMLVLRQTTLVVQESRYMRLRPMDQSASACRLVLLIVLVYYLILKDTGPVGRNGPVVPVFPSCAGSLVEILGAHCALCRNVE